MKEQVIRDFARHGISVICAALLVSFPFGAPLAAQEAAPPPPPPAAQQPASAPQLTPDQLDDLVAPIALYPDPLLSEVLVASTYPLEVVEASQWLQQNQGLQGQARMNAARQQNWDPSIQALVAFPDVLSRLSSDVNWTTALGNAFLAQQADVMSAVQQMRARAQSSGRLSSDAQETVTTQTQNGQSAIDIMPANPQVIYVPEYNPAYIWGPPAWGYYPDLYYPPVGFGFGFYPGIYLGGFFGGWGGWGWGGWGGWGWGPNWFGGSIFLNAGFFGHWGFHNFYGGFGGGGIWAHNPYHRLGVPYPNARLGQRFGGNYIGRGGAIHAGAGIGAQRGAGFAGGQFRGAQSFGAGRSGGNFQHFGGAAGAARGGAANGGGWQRFNGSSGAPRSGAFGGANRVAPQGQSFGRGNSQGFSGGGRSFGSAPAYRAPSSGGGRSFSGSQPRSFGGGGSRSFSGGGGSRSFGGGGGGFHGGGGGGGFHGGGGGGSHGGGGGHSGRR